MFALAADEALEVRWAGGKAAPLAALRRLGVPVPPGVVIPPEWFQSFLSDNGWEAEARRAAGGEESARSALAAKISQGVFSDHRRLQLERAVQTLGGVVAVRSSALDEDRAGRSMAGQYESVLGVGKSGVVPAVLRCWQSYYSGTAFAYRDGDGPAPGGMAVLIQRQLDPAVSGVAFTINPLNGSWREMMVEAVYGLGVGLVDGRLNPHWYLLRRPRRLPRRGARVVARARVQRLEEDTPALDSKWIRDGQNIVQASVPSAQRARSALSPSDVRRIARITLRIEAARGAPQDVEWALDERGQFWVLQARPITTGGGASDEPNLLWTRRFTGERFPEPLTPLAWSVVEETLSTFVGYQGVERRFFEGMPAIRSIDGYVYTNAAIFSKLAFKLPGMEPPRFLTELLGPDEAQRFRRRVSIAPNWGLYASYFSETVLGRRDRLFAWDPLTNPKRWRSFEGASVTQLQALRNCPPGQGLDELFDLYRGYLGIHVCSLLFANMAEQAVSSLLGTWVPERAVALHRRLVTTPPGNRTIEVNKGVWELAQQVTEEDLSTLGQNEIPEGPGGIMIRDFLDRFGDRSSAAWDLYAPTWRGEPSLLVPLIRAAQLGDRDPEAIARAQEAAFNDAVSEIRETVGGAQRLVLLDTVRRLREYLLLRENQRFWFEKLQAAARRVFQGMGQELIRAGILEDAGDIRWMSLTEIRDQQLVSVDELGRRKVRFNDQSRHVPPTFVDHTGRALSVDADEYRLLGVGMSPGRAEGRVRIVRRMTDSVELQPGEVLVAPAIDPAWTPLFLTASAVILQLGSRLSHGAILAREYGVPAVVNVDDVLGRLRDGDRVVVDGSRGIVFIQQKKSPEE